MKSFTPSLLLLITTAASAENVANKEPTPEGPQTVVREAAVSMIEPEALAGFDHYAPQIQQLIRNALALTKLNLRYTFGSSSPKQGGMDCSGTIFHLLSDFGFRGVPRQSDEMAGWVQEKTLLHRITAADTLAHPEFSALQPGDLLFWSGTYASAPRKIPVTHVMLYLGKLKKSGKPVVFGASDGRVYQGERRSGVSVFDLSLPKFGSPTAFYGYGLIPGVGKIVAKPKEPIIAAAPPEIEKKEAPPVTVSVKDEKPPAKEEVRRAEVLPSKPAGGSAPPKSSTEPKSPTPKAKAPAKKKSSPLPPPTPKDKLQDAARRVTDALRDAFGK